MTIRHLRLLLLLVACAAGADLGAATQSMAATIAVTPATYLAALAAAQSGDVLTAPADTYPAATLANRVFAPPVTLSAAPGAVFGQLTLRAVDGFTVVGASFSNNPLYGVLLDHTRNVVLDRIELANERSGLAVGYAVGLTVTYLECRALQQDCIDLYASQHVRILHAAIHGGVPRAGAHPDGVQMRSDVGTPPMTDVEIAFSHVVGNTAGFDLFGNDVAAIGINVHDNDGAIAETSLVNLLGGGCTGCRVVNNRADLFRTSTHVANVLPNVPTAGFEVGGNVVSARPAALPH